MSELFQNTLPITEVKHALQIIKSENGDALTYYHAAVFLDNASTEEQLYDADVEHGISLALKTGLYAIENKDYFLDALYKLSHILLKYQKWHEAFNWLKLSAQLKEDAPGWVSNYLAKLHFEINPDEAFDSPMPVMSKLAMGSRDPAYRVQALNIFRDFILCAKCSFDQISDHKQRQDRYESFEQKIRQFLLKTESNETHFIPASYKFLFDFQSENNVPLIDNCVQSEALFRDSVDDTDTINSLKFQLAEESQLVEDLTNENARLHQHIAILENELKKITNRKRFEELTEIKKDRLKILILGGSQLKEKDMMGILKSYGLEKNNVIIKDYDETKKFDISKLRFNSPYCGILIGPVAHKVVGMGDYTSLISKLRNEAGFPVAIEIRSIAGELKITKTAFKTAIGQLLLKIRSIDPENKQFIA